METTGDTIVKFTADYIYIYIYIVCPKTVNIQSECRDRIKSYQSVFDIYYL